MNVTQVIPRDAIPSVDDPAFDREFFGDPADEVLVFAPESGPARAYPIRILDYHEIVNDRVDGRPIAVTWCPLCGSAIVYDRTVGGDVLSFGVSGKLADDDLVMYDRETESEWKQSSGACIAGEVAGEELDVLPANLLSWERFAERYPDGLTLSRPGGASEAASGDDTPAEIDYDAGPYDAYFERDGFGLGAHRGADDPRDWGRDDLDPKAVVLGIERGGDALGVPLPAVESAGGVVAVTVGGDDIAVFATRDGIHAFESGGRSFERTAQPGVFRADGARWDGATGVSDDGRELMLVPVRRLFAFAWQDDHGPDAFYPK